MAPPSSVAVPRERTPLAVLPIDDQRLFRAERAQLRSQLALEIARRAPEPGGLLGGLAGSGSNSNLAKAGPISVCEEKSFGACQPESAAWLDRAKELAACHRDADDVEDELLVDSSASPARCEIVGLDDTASPAGKREACACAAALSSAGARAKPGRRVIRVRYEAPDLAGKPRPELRVLDATTNLHAEEDWHPVRSARPPPSSRPVHRLHIDNLDGFAAPLARCVAAPGATLVAELDVEEHGAVRAARLRSDGLKREVSACVEKALMRGSLACTRDGKPAEVRVAMTWPAALR